MGDRFTGRQIVTMVVAISAAVVLAPVGALAATGSLVNITDPVHRDQKARVSGDGRLLVGDGGEALTVDGSTLPYPKATAFSRTVLLQDTPLLVKPGVAAGTKIMITSLSYSSLATSGEMALEAQDGATANCTGGTPGQMYFDMISPAIETKTATFPSPLIVDRCAELRPFTAGWVTITGYTS